jgi:hypothetical protein
LPALQSAACAARYWNGRSIRLADGAVFADSDEYRSY